jgi:hypothetical protein
MFKKSFEFSNKLKTYKNDAKEAAFLLGGIGTGNFSIGARGDMYNVPLVKTQFSESKCA